MKSRNNKPELEAIESIWYKKLHESGFRDIEITTKKSRPLIRNHCLDFGLKDALQFTTKQEYYRAAEYLCTYFRFDTEIDKTIWEKHAQGIPVREIVEQIDGYYEKSQIARIIKKIAIKAEIKK